MISITALEKSISSLKRKLEKRGFDVELEVFKSGRGGDYYVGSTSYVEITVERDGEYIGSYKFKANDYVSGGYRRTYGGHSIKQMKVEFLRDFEKDCK